MTKDVYSNKVGYGEPSNGDDSSDTIKELQECLNRVKLVDGSTLPITGYYGDQTDREVRLWQEQVCLDTPDPAGKSYLGPEQFARMFPEPTYIRHDAGLPQVATGNPSQPPPGQQPPAAAEKPAAPALMYPGAVWEPITNFPGLRPYAGSAKKVTLHTTETSQKPNWEAQQSGIPHLTVDLFNNRVWQHLDFGIAAYTLSGGEHSPNSDAGQNIQIEIIGYAIECPVWSDQEYGHLRTVLAWLQQSLGVPYAFPFPFGGSEGYGKDGAYRQDWDVYARTSGIMAHQHASYNDHWDCGALDVSRLLSAPVGEVPPAADDFISRAEFEDFQESLAEAFRTIADMVDPDIPKNGILS